MKLGEMAGSGVGVEERGVEVVDVNTVNVGAGEAKESYSGDAVKIYAPCELNLGGGGRSILCRYWLSMEEIAVEQGKFGWSW